MGSKHFQIVSFLLLTTSVILASCGGGGSSSAPPPAPSLAVKGSSGNAVDLNGTWDGGCSYDTLAQQNKRDIVTLNGGSATFTNSVWDAPLNANCTQTATPDILFKGTVTATLSSDPTATAIWIDETGAVSSPPAGISATAKAAKTTLVFNSATVTFNLDLYVVNANSGNGFCGHTNWVKGVPKDVLNCTDALQSTTETEYWVVDDSAAQLKWYHGANGVAWQVDNFRPRVK